MLSVYFLIACLVLIVVAVSFCAYVAQRTRNDAYGFFAFVLLIISLVVGSKLYEKLDALDKEAECPIRQMK